MKTGHNLDVFNRKYELDLVIVGGGVAGTVAAIAAARLGLKTGLMQNRPVLGGPSSNECFKNCDGTYVNGASNYRNRNARETGIIEEMKIESKFRIEQGWHSHWSFVMREWVENEKNVILWMNTEAFKVEMENGRRIKSVSGRAIGSETTVVFKAPLFIDASGDGFLGYAAGAEYRMGRESKDEFNESLAPEKADSKTMGQTIMFEAKDMGKPVKFVPPVWAMKFESDNDLPFRCHDNPKGGYWWIEYGGEMDTIADNEIIYRTLLSALYGVWDHIKNHGDHGAENLAIDWISLFPGKRESRRFIGDYMLTQNDVMSDRQFEDNVAYGGWPIDLHPPEGILGNSHPASAPPVFFPKTYGIPFRCLYSKNVENLMMAGRDISVTHVALGTTRVMATCALTGQAVGTAAHIIKKHELKSPAEIYRDKKILRELQRTLLQNDVALPAMPLIEDDNIALKARADASSSMPLAVHVTNDYLSLVPPDKSAGKDHCDVPPYADRRRAQMFPVSQSRIDKVAVKCFSSNSGPVKVKASLMRGNRADDFNGGELAGIAETEVSPGAPAWAYFDFNAEAVPGKLYWILIEPVENVNICLSKMPVPGLYLKPDGCYPNDFNFCFEVFPRQYPFGPENAINGHSRAGDWPNIWMSDPALSLPQHLDLTFKKEEKFNCIRIVFDTNLNTLVKSGAAPECCRDYEILAPEGENWKPIVRVEGNHYRFVEHKFDEVSSKKVRLKINATNGDASARVYEVGIYHTE